MGNGEGKKKTCFVVMGRVLDLNQRQDIERVLDSMNDQLAKLPALNP